MRKYLKWLTICILIFCISVFLHECGHGIANALARIPCSTGFNRVGDIYKYPTDNDFRSFYSTTNPVLLDFGVPCTIILGIIGTIIFIKAKKDKIKLFAAALAIDNCLLRFIPCSLVLFTPLITGKIHVEDEYETGQLLVKLTGSNIWQYIPTFISWAITATCLMLLIKNAKKRNINHILLYSILSFLAIII